MSGIHWNEDAPRALALDGLVLGLLDISAEISDRAVAIKYRDFTLSWSRYDYRGEIIEAATVDQILELATNGGHRWCLILPHGFVIAERWIPGHGPAPNFFSALRNCVAHSEFLVAGTIALDEASWFGFENRCLFVNLSVYQQLSAPRFDACCPRPIVVPKARPVWDHDRISALLPTGDTEVRQPALVGWNLIAASLQHKVPVIGFDEPLRRGLLDLSATCPARTRAIAKYLDQGIANYRGHDADHELGADQAAFLDMIQPQTRGARNGAFLWNIESYADIELPREDFKSPVSSLYCVAAGFKPNRILHTHGWDDETRVVFFDYSPNALKIRQYMLDHWDGEDFPEFVQELFRVFPYPATYYQLWEDATPEGLDPLDVRRRWQCELDRWGGSGKFRDHWRAYRKLPHVFVECDILTNPAPLLEQMRAETGAVIWWSNAFFTVYGNWFFSIEERRQMYERWMDAIVEASPDLSLFGSDYNNINVNSVRAAGYWHSYRSADRNERIPCPVFKIEIRM